MATQPPCWSVVKTSPRSVHPDPAGRSQARRHGDQPAPRCHLHGPAPPGVGTGFQISDGGVEREPEVPVPVDPGAVGVFVVVAGEAPVVGDGEVLVDHAVTVQIPEPGQLAPLGQIKGVAMADQAQGLVERLGDPAKSEPFGRFLVGALDQPDLSPSDGCRNLAIRQEFQAADLEGDRFRDGEGDDAIVVLFLRAHARGEPQHDREKEAEPSHHEISCCTRARPSRNRIGSSNSSALPERRSCATETSGSRSRTLRPSAE